MALTAKLAILPSDNPPTRQKLATVAATSTSSGLPFSLGLCSRDGADIMHMLVRYPFERPNKKRISMNRKSELMIASVSTVVGSRWILHMRKRGMNSVRVSERVRRRFADHMSKDWNEHIYRPKKSPMLNTRKCIALNNNECIVGLTG